MLHTLLHRNASRFCTPVLQQRMCISSCGFNRPISSSFVQQKQYTAITATARCLHTSACRSWHSSWLCASQASATSASSTAPASVSSATHSAAASSTCSPSSPSSPSPSSSSSIVSSLVSGIVEGDRVSLSRAITLCESTLPTHQQQAQQLLETISKERRRKERERNDSVEMTEKATTVTDASLTASASCAAAHSSSSSTSSPSISSLTRRRSLRIGISGAPGVGKSSFLECFGSFLCREMQQSIAVLSIDPSSSLSGGSILGDKTRMVSLSREKRAFIRPSPSRGVLGGVGTNTSEAILLCEAAGYDVVFIETVGVGQSEAAVRDMCDMLLLIVQPAGGDELQAMKKGIVELVDLVIVNKSDGALLPAARHTKTEFMHALQLNTARKRASDWKPQVRLCSSVNQTGGTNEYRHTDRATAKAAEQHTSATTATATSAPAPATGAAATASRASQAPQPQQQREQLEEIWRTICHFEEWSKGPNGDFYARRAKQSHALLLQAVQHNVSSRLLQALPSLRNYQQIDNRLTGVQKDRRADAAASEIVPRVAAQRIVDEWLSSQSPSPK